VSGQFRVPATPGGPNQHITFVSGNVSKTVSFEVAPRIKILDSPAVRGHFVNVSLRGYARGETVRIRWRQGERWITLATIITSNTGSANTSVQVPGWAPNGFNSVRGDGTVFRQQTNAVYVQGGPHTALSLSLATLGVLNPGPRRTSPSRAHRMFARNIPAPGGREVSPRRAI
jgi:hypothetical protein